MALLVDPRLADEVALKALLRLRAPQLTPARPHMDPSRIETDWRTWLAAMFPRYFRDSRGQPTDFATFHAEFWDWLWAIHPGVRPNPFVGIWARGAGKSTSVEAACAAVGALKTRKYVLYVCRTQDQADDHVQNVATMLESDEVALYYPHLADRLVGKYGNAKGWRRDRLRTASGFTVDAIGLDVAVRGVKLDADRPDLIIVDDVDDPSDSAATISKKVVALTHGLLPAGSEDAGVLAVQNLIHPLGIFGQLADGSADYLADRVVSGPHKALEDLAYEQQDGRFVIVAGTPTWAGMSLDKCQARVDQYGLTAFLNECQHEVQEPAGGMFDHLVYRHCTADEVPEVVRTVVWVDPAVTDTDESDAQGIHADSLGANGLIYRRWSWEGRTSPLKALLRAITVASRLGADHVGVETDQGGDTWESVYVQALELLTDANRPMPKGFEEFDKLPPGARVPRFAADKAGASRMSKTERAAQMLADYERGKFVHVLGTHAVLEKGLHRFPRKKPYDLVDASYWAWHDLMEGVGDKDLADMLRGGLPMSVKSGAPQANTTSTMATDTWMQRSAPAVKAEPPRIVRFE